MGYVYLVFILVDNVHLVLIIIANHVNKDTFYLIADVFQLVRMGILVIRNHCLVVLALAIAKVVLISPIVKVVLLVILIIQALIHVKNYLYATPPLVFVKIVSLVQVLLQFNVLTVIQDTFYIKESVTVLAHKVTIQIG
jgi:amino acid transporter